MNTDEVIHHPDGSWESFEHFRLRKQWEEGFWNKVMFGNFEKHEPRPDENVKLAWVLINGQRKMIGVDNKTMQGYELREDIPSWKIPLVEIKYDSMERWCTTFDV